MVDLKGRCVNVAVLGTLRWPRYSIWELTLNNARLTDRCTSTDDDVSECHLHCRSKMGSSEYHYIILFDFKDMWVTSPTFRSRSRILLTSRGVFPSLFTNLLLYFLSFSLRTRPVIPLFLTALLSVLFPSRVISFCFLCPFHLFPPICVSLSLCIEEAPVWHSSKQNFLNPWVPLFTSKWKLLRVRRTTWLSGQAQKHCTVQENVCTLNPPQNSQHTSANYASGTALTTTATNFYAQTYSWVDAVTSTQCKTK